MVTSGNILCAFKKTELYQKGGEEHNGRVIRLSIEKFEVQIQASAEICIEISTSPVFSSQLSYDEYTE